MELLFAGAATLLGQGVVGAVDNREANHTILYSLETLIHIVLPQSQAFHYTAILNIQTHTHTHPIFLRMSIKTAHLNGHLNLYLT